MKDLSVLNHGPMLVREGTSKITFDNCSALIYAKLRGERVVLKANPGDSFTFTPGQIYFVSRDSLGSMSIEAVSEVKIPLEFVLD